MAERKIIHYASEVLSLLCEWEECSKTVCEIEAFISHITLEHLTKLSEGCLNIYLHTFSYSFDLYVCRIDSFSFLYYLYDILNNICYYYYYLIGICM